MHKKDNEHIRIIAKLYDLPEDVVRAVVRSPYEFIRNNSKELISVRIPNFGLFAVKPNRLKKLNERKAQKGNKDSTKG